MTVMRNASPKAASRTWLLLCLALAVTGLGQMPLFKRYYIADLPGMAWTADYALLHTAHYLLAAAFLALAGAWLGGWLARRGRLTASGALRVLVVAGLAGTGFVRVAKNMSGVWLSPTLVLAVDWAHLGFAMLFGALAVAAIWRKTPYLKGGKTSEQRPGALIPPSV